MLWYFKNWMPKTEDEVGVVGEGGARSPYSRIPLHSPNDSEINNVLFVGRR